MLDDLPELVKCT